MQFAKDSFYAVLRERLAALNPARTVIWNGAERPGLIVLENEQPNSVEQLAETFYLEWGPGKPAAQAGGAKPILALSCTFRYYTTGSSESGVDRGRKLGEMDAELLQICQPCHTPKRDYRQSPSADLGTGLFWTVPEFGAVSESGKGGYAIRARQERAASLTVFFFPEEVYL